jgi:tight adherence protein C
MIDWIPYFIVFFVFIAISAVAYFLLQKPEVLNAENKLQISPLLIKLCHLQHKFGFSKWIAYYNQKIADAGLWDKSLTGEKILVGKEFVVLFLVLFCLFFQVPFFFSFLMVATGFFFFDIYLRDRINRRRLEIVRSLPDFLDTLGLTMEAGLDFGVALQTILQKSRINALLGEFETAIKEIRMGANRGTALQNMASRLKIRDINIFVNAVMQAEQMGTGLSQTLRVQAEANRERRMQRAEKLALEAPVKMVFPLVAFIFPVVFIVLIGPIIIQWLER